MQWLRWTWGLVALTTGLFLQVASATAERRVALVIGNSAYRHTTHLPNPRNDAADLSVALQRMRFEVAQGLDLNKRDMEGMIREFTRAITGADAALLFYAGHSVQVGKQNFLMPVDAQLAREADVDFETIPLTLVLRHMQSQAKTSIVFLDACRDNPLARTLARNVPTRSSYFGRGLAPVEAAGVDTLVGFSTQPDNVANDGLGRNSPYAAALLKHIDAGVDIGQVLMRVRLDVLGATQQQQVPWEHSSLTRPFYFNASPSIVSVQPSVPVSERPLASAQPPNAVTSTGNPPFVHSEITSRILSWVEREYLDDRVTYAATVDWYDKGVISRDAVLQDRAKYLASWPERRFTLVPGTLQVADAGPNRYTANFRVTYWVRNARGEQRSGNSHISVDLMASGSQLVLARQKEIVQRQR